MFEGEKKMAQDVLTPSLLIVMLEIILIFSSLKYVWINPSSVKIFLVLMILMPFSLLSFLI